MRIRLPEAMFNFDLSYLPSVGFNDPVDPVLGLICYDITVAESRAEIVWNTFFINKHNRLPVLRKRSSLIIRLVAPGLY